MGKPQAATFVLRWLVEHSGEPFPTGQIAKQLGLSDRHLRREITTLLDSGRIEGEHTPGQPWRLRLSGSATTADKCPGESATTADKCPGESATTADKCPGGSDICPGGSDIVIAVKHARHAPASDPDLEGRKEINPSLPPSHEPHAPTNARKDHAPAPATPEESADLARLQALAWRVWGEPHAYANLHLRGLIGLLPGPLALRYLSEAKRSPDVQKYSRYPLSCAGKRDRALAWLALQNEAETKVSTQQQTEKSPEKESLEGKKGELAPVQLPPVVLQLDDRHAPVQGPSIALDTDGEAPAVAGCEPGRPVPGSGWSGAGLRVWGGYFYFRRHERQMWSPQGRVPGASAADRAPGEALARPAHRAAAGGPVLGLAPSGGGCYLGGAPRREAAE